MSWQERLAFSGIFLSHVDVINYFFTMFLEKRQDPLFKTYSVAIMYLPDLFLFISSKCLLECEYFCLEVDIFYWAKMCQHKWAFCEGCNYRRPCAGCLWLFYWWVMQSVPQLVEESYLMLWSDILLFCSHLFREKTFPNFQCLPRLIGVFCISRGTNFRRIYLVGI